MTTTNRLASCYWPAPAPNANTYSCALLTSTPGYTPRDGCKVEFFDGKYWLLGGWWPTMAPDGPNGWSATNITTNEVWSSVDLLTWTLELAHDDNPPTSGPGARWKPVHTMPTWVHDGLLWVAAGDDYDSGQDPPGTVRSDVWNSPDGLVWTRVAATSPWGYGEGLWNAVPGLYNGEMHLLGGQRAAFPGQPVNDRPACREHWRSTDGVNWERLPDMPFAVSRVLRALPLDGKLFVVGGGTGEIGVGVTFSRTWGYDGTYWREMSTDSNGVWIGREWIATAVFDDKLWAATGVHRETVENQSGCFMSRDLGRSWEKVGSLWQASHADGLAVGPDGLVLCTGRLQYTNVFLVTPD